MLAMDRVGKTYPNGVHALERFSAEIKPGEIVAIIGGSGCGKSTLLRAIAGLDRATTGTVTLDNSVITAPHAKIGIDLRYVEPPQRAEAMGRIQAIVDHATIPGTSARLEIRGEFLPLVQDEGSREVFEAYRGAMGELGVEVAGEFSGGCADSGFTSAVGCPTVCATGPVGGKAHSPDEYLEVSSIVPRAQGLALAISRLG